MSCLLLAHIYVFCRVQFIRWIIALNRVVRALRAGEQSDLSIRVTWGSGATCTIYTYPKPVDSICLVRHPRRQAFGRETRPSRLYICLLWHERYRLPGCDWNARGNSHVTVILLSNFKHGCITLVPGLGSLIVLNLPVNLSVLLDGCIPPP